jgi:hypothetical protein
MAIMIIPMSFIIEVLISIHYYKKSKITENKSIIVLKFSVLIFIATVLFGYEYKVTEMTNVENYLENVGNIVNQYRIDNNIKCLSEDDFVNINLNEKVAIKITEDGYSLSYKYGRFYYSYKDGEGRVRVRRH